MLLQHIKAHNFRTYAELDLSLSVSPEKPLVIIGGANGGGKTTLFEAIHATLYGLHIPDAEAFRREVNAGALAAGTGDNTIELELRFTGKILSQPQQYVITRTWVLNSEQRVNWGVKMNMAGNVFAYGSASTEKERQQAEVQVNKIIKANLPRELAQYFLFDTTKAEQKLSADQLGKVIRENIENVMGLRKYLDLGAAARLVQENMQASRLKAQAVREEYRLLTEQQRQDESRLRDMAEGRDNWAAERQSLEELVADLQKERDQEGVLKGRLEQMEKQKRDLLRKEAHFRDQLDEFVKLLEPSVALPYLAEALQGEIAGLRAQYARSPAERRSQWSKEALYPLVESLDKYMESRGLHLANWGLSREDLAQCLYEAQSASEPAVAGIKPELDEAEWHALDGVCLAGSGNPFPALDMVRQELQLAISGLPAWERQAEDYRARLAGKDYSSLLRYDALTAQIQALDVEMEEVRKRLADNAKRIQQFDVAHMDGPDPRFDAACRLKAWFEEAADELLKAKKKRIESTLRDDLNKNIVVYHDVIDRVELSENLRNLTFRIFHKAGNEIYLGQLNAAAKQVVIQVLLKVLHESGDYDPPVMIDTVMGALDQESRAVILKNYFPSLSHQTILLSTNSEIDPVRDWPTLQPHTGLAYTLVRDVEAQSTSVRNGYFGKMLEAT